LNFVQRVIAQLLADLWAYYSSPFPLLLLIGTFRRITRRAKALWLPVDRGRPPVRDDVVDLILDTKRSNWSWGALRISQELLLLGIRVHKKTVQRIPNEMLATYVDEHWSDSIPWIHFDQYDINESTLLRSRKGIEIAHKPLPKTYSNLPT
jgi:hypothetical protein